MKSRASKKAFDDNADAAYSEYSKAVMKTAPKLMTWRNGERETIMSWTRDESLIEHLLRNVSSSNDDESDLDNDNESNLDDNDNNDLDDNDDNKPCKEDGRHSEQQNQTSSIKISNYSQQPPVKSIHNANVILCLLPLTIVCVAR